MNKDGSQLRESVLENLCGNVNPFAPICPTDDELLDMFERKTRRRENQRGDWFYPVIEDMKGRERDLSLSYLPYGYRSSKIDGGETIRIDREEAFVIERIFDEYAEYKPIRSIVDDLNLDYIPSPSSREWELTDLVGYSRTKCGIFHQSLYEGLYAKNRCKWIKDSNSKGYICRERARSEWVIDRIPRLSIVPPELWDEALVRLEEVQVIYAF